MRAPERVLFVHAHPDDETISTGATIATLVARGSEVTVLTCTRGELGEVIPAELQYLLASPADVGEYRLGELRAALAALGVSDHRMLGDVTARWPGRAPRTYADSGMKWGSGGPEPLDSPDEGSLTAADQGEVAADIAAVLVSLEPDVVVSYDSDGGYGHPDHVRVHAATRTAAEVIGVPFYVIDASGDSDLVVDPAPVIAQKRAALAAYRTQVTIDGDSFSLSSGDPLPIAAPEGFTRLRPVVASDRMGWVGLTAAALLALLLGFVAGVTLTAAHQSSVLVVGVAVPWGIIVALVVTATLLAGLRIVFATRVVPAAAGIGMIAAIALLARTTSGGTVLVPANPAGWTWLVAPIVFAVVVLAWPSGRAPRPRPRATKPQVASAPNDKIETPPAPKGPDPT